MKFLFSIIVVLAVFGANAALNSQQSNQELFREFIEKYDRHYKTIAEHRLRYGIFVNNLQKIKQMQESEVGTAIYGINKFSDFTTEELRSLTGVVVPQAKFNVSKTSAELITIPTNFDWRKHNAVTAVKNQGSSPASEVFSAIANIEGQFAIKHGLLLSFSEQEIIDCGYRSGKSSVYDTIIKVGGLEIEADYPFVGRNEKCKFDKAKVIAQLKNSTALPTDEFVLAKWLSENGPVSVYINSDPFVTYQSGIIHNWKCKGKTNLNHAVTLVGYGTTDIYNDYWIVKNSWGADWGEQGYARLARGFNMCGVAEFPTSAIVK